MVYLAVGAVTKAKKKKDGPMGGASGRQKKVARRAEVLDDTDWVVDIQLICLHVLK